MLQSRGDVGVLVLVVVNHGDVKKKINLLCGCVDVYMFGLVVPALGV